MRRRRTRSSPWTLHRPLRSFRHPRALVRHQGFGYADHAHVTRPRRHPGSRRGPYGRPTRVVLWVAMPPSTPSRSPTSSTARARRRRGGGSRNHRGRCASRDEGRPAGRESGRCIGSRPAPRRSTSSSVLASRVRRRPEGGAARGRPAQPPRGTVRARRGTPSWTSMPGLSAQSPLVPLAETVHERISPSRSSAAARAAAGSARPA